MVKICLSRTVYQFSFVLLYLLSITKMLATLPPSTHALTPGIVSEIKWFQLLDKCLLHMEYFWHIGMFKVLLRSFSAFQIFDNLASHKAMVVERNGLTVNLRDTYLVYTGQPWLLSVQDQCEVIQCISDSYNSIFFWFGPYTCSHLRYIVTYM